MKPVFLPNCMFFIHLRSFCIYLMRPSPVRPIAGFQVTPPYLVLCGLCGVSWNHRRLRTHTGLGNSGTQVSSCRRDIPKWWPNLTEKYSSQFISIFWRNIRLSFEKLACHDISVKTIIFRDAQNTGALRTLVLGQHDYFDKPGEYKVLNYEIDPDFRWWYRRGYGYEIFIASCTDKEYIRMETTFQ